LGVSIFVKHGIIMWVGQIVCIGLPFEGANGIGE